MSRITATKSKVFVTEYLKTGKTSEAMVSACVAMMQDGTKGPALVAAVRGAYSANPKAPALSAPEQKKFDTLVSQRAYAASLVLTVGDDAASDTVAIKAALRVSSGAYPRAKASEIAESFKDSNDAPAFGKAIDAALKAHKSAPRTPRKTADEKSAAAAKGDTATAETINPSESARLAFTSGLELIESALKSPGLSADARAAMLKSLKATLLRAVQAPAAKPAAAAAKPALKPADPAIDAARKADAAALAKVNRAKSAKAEAARKSAMLAK